ncbi:MAG: VCBS repeat-containing protein [Verrucomicrobia bacterium]|nr:VCBS repeat-containing protein [Verrucomicrobiota bacterium]
MASRKSIPHLLLKRTWILASVAVIDLPSDLPTAAAPPTLQWETNAGARSAPLIFDETGQPGFTPLSALRTGIDFANYLSDEKASENQIRLNGSGVALGDIDGDGWCDIYLCRLEGGNVLYRNLGDWKFESIDITSGAGCADQFSTGAAFSDVDGDGDLDLLVTGIGVGTRLFLNNGGGTFEESRGAGLIGKLGAGSMALADIDQDGDLDLYVANYRTTTIRTTGFAVMSLGGRRMIQPQDRNRLEYTPEGRVLEHGEPDLLYRNDGTGRFVPDSWAQGTFHDEEGTPLMKPPFDWGLSAMFRDINGDGSPDLYVCNDFHSTDKIWINDGKGRFRLISKYALRNTSTFSMSVDFGDLDRDGFDDIFVADMLSLKHSRRLMQLAAADAYLSPVGVFDDRPQFDRNTLQWNRGDGTFAEIAFYAGLPASEWTWSAVLLDVDLDGFEDLLCSTGHMFDTQDLDAEARIRARGPWRTEMIPKKLLLFPKMRQSNVAFRNRGDMTFEDASAKWGFDQLGVSHGMALGDLDNDGDLDVVVNNLNEPAGIYRNNCPNPRMAVRLKGNPSNRFGIGAKIRVSGAAVRQSQEMISGGRYLSCDEALRVFAAGSKGASLTIEVQWPNGRTTSIEKVKADRVYEILEPNAVVTPATSETQTAELHPENARSDLPLFEDVSDLIAHEHVDEPFDDFVRQPLLPRKLSQLGPGIAWFDVNHDGWDDLIIGSGRGGQMSVYLNNTKGGFDKREGAEALQQQTRDQTGVLAWGNTPGQTAFVFGSSNYEDGLPIGAAVRQLDTGNGQFLDVASGRLASTGPLAMADVDSDGDLDLFVGDRCIPGKWPEPADSLLCLNTNGRLEIDSNTSAPFASAGLVSGAVFTDLNGDGWPDLALACEWGAVRVFINERGRFKDATAVLGLAPFVGIWGGIHAGDFDGDGRLDLAASNWGLNSPYQTPRESKSAEVLFSSSALEAGLAGVFSPLLYFGDFDGNSSIDMIEAVFDPDLKKTVPIRSFNAISQGLPMVRERFQSFDEFNRADVFQIAGEAHRNRAPLRLTWLASTVFLNRGDHFEPVPLPSEAQVAPGFAVCVADFDGNGTEDIFMSQNFFPVHPSSSRLDAGRSVVLMGNGRGEFSAVPGSGSGVAVYGEGRGAAVSDFDGDGRVDLAVAQNGAPTLLYRNTQARPGVRVTLQGGASNSSAVGAAVRLISGERRGPVREIHLGSGYWSQDSSTVVMAKIGEPQQIWVRWPGGQETVKDVPKGATEISLAP